MVFPSPELHNRAFPLFAVTVVIALSGSISSVSAQNAQEKPPVATAPTAPPSTNRVWRLFEIKNLSARQLASWLGPAPNGEQDKKKNSLEIVNPYLNREQAKKEIPPVFVGSFINHSRSGSNRGVFPLPEGVEAIYPLDNQNAILVFGIESGVKELGDTIKFLDKPLRQIEIETHVVKIDPDDCPDLGLAPAPNHSHVASFHAVSSDSLSKLNELKKQCKAEEIWAPWITKIEARTLGVAFINISTTTLVIPSTGNLEKESKQWFHNTFKLLVTPTLAPGGTIDLLIEPYHEISRGLSQILSQPLIPEIRNDPQYITTVKDGETVASSDILGSGIVVFITARRVPHDGEVEAVSH